MSMGNIRTQNNMFTIYRALNVGCTEVNLDLEKPVWQF